MAQFTTAEGLRNNGIQAFAEDRNNHLWIGTSSGISVWDGVHFKNYYLEDGLSYGWVRAIVQDRNGDMLVGTDRGINRFHDGRFVTNPMPLATQPRSRVVDLSRLPEFVVGRHARRSTGAHP